MKGEEILINGGQTNITFAEGRALQDKGEGFWVGKNVVILEMSADNVGCGIAAGRAGFFPGQKAITGIEENSQMRDGPAKLNQVRSIVVRMIFDADGQTEVMTGAGEGSEGGGQPFQLKFKRGVRRAHEAMKRPSGDDDEGEIECLFLSGE